jgi:hypothetical protein
MSKVRLLTHKGTTLPLAHWAKKIGISRSALAQRLRLGWSVSDALSIPHTRCYGHSKLKRPVAATATVEPVVSVTSLRLDELKRMDLMLQREVTRALRQFARDLDAIMTRGVDRDLLKTLNDRLIPSTPERV